MDSLVAGTAAVSLLDLLELSAVSESVDSAALPSLPELFSVDAELVESSELSALEASADLPFSPSDFVASSLELEVSLPFLSDAEELAPWECSVFSCSCAVAASAVPLTASATPCRGVAINAIATVRTTVSTFDQMPYFLNIIKPFEPTSMQHAETCPILS
ncbi:hypothetical protein ACTNC1_01725 [Atopobiaceae bacterium HCP3S3_A4]